MDCLSSLESTPAVDISKNQPGGPSKCWTLQDKAQMTLQKSEIYSVKQREPTRWCPPSDVNVGL